MICRSGARSAQACRSLVALGFTRVMNLRGGMLAWNQAKLPIVRP
jgi:rhodanese-related sulfurtransferase